MTTPYRRGASLERRVKKHLEAKGWYVVRAAGSKGLSDLVAVRNGNLTGWQTRIAFLQCKRSGKINPRELHDFQQLVERIHGAEGYVVRVCLLKRDRRLEAREILFWERAEWEPLGSTM